VRPASCGHFLDLRRVSPSGGLQTGSTRLRRNSRHVPQDHPKKPAPDSRAIRTDITPLPHTSQASRDQRSGTVSSNRLLDKKAGGCQFHGLRLRAPVFIARWPSIFLPPENCGRHLLDISEELPKRSLMAYRQGAVRGRVTSPLRHRYCRNAKTHCELISFSAHQ